MDEEDWRPSDLKHKCRSDTELRSASLSEPIVSSDVDDEQVFTFNEEPNENEVTVASTDETGGETAEHPAPKRRSYLLALGRRILSAGKKLFCCGGCGHKKVTEKTKWKYFRGPP